MLRVNAIDYRGSVCDGPGIRTVVYLQGCTRRCPNCHNPGTWDADAGRLVPAEELAEEVALNAPSGRVTISGGEPLLQAPGLVKLLAELRERGVEVALYTSYERREVPDGVVELVDYLKTGTYVDGLRTTVKPYVGSSNQRFERVA